MQFRHPGGPVAGHRGVGLGVAAALALCRRHGDHGDPVGGQFGFRLLPGGTDGSIFTAGGPGRLSGLGGLCRGAFGPGLADGERQMIPRRCSVEEFNFAVHVDGQEREGGDENEASGQSNHGGNSGSLTSGVAAR